MADYALATVRNGASAWAAMVIGDSVHPIPDRPQMGDLLADWDAWCSRLDELAQGGGLERAGSVGDVDLGPAVPHPPNLYMAGANYADHAREMRGLAADAEVPKPALGPFMFLKPTTSIVAHGDAVRISPGAERVDWEVELAVVIGRGGYRVAAVDASSLIAGYTIANDVSVRGRFAREDITEAPMKFDWFSQKAWATSCPLGPWLVPAAQLPDAQDTLMRLTLNGEVQQEASTAEMIFSIAEQIEFITSIVALVPGDVVCTGTCAGVGMAKGRFLSPGDVMVAEIAGIGALRNPVTGG
jgi:2,4-didehydro-3-deoxy-L-rhamnonate hydrolase